jgi:hypothetical protein
VDFFKELAVFIEGKVRVEADPLNQSAIQCFSFASGWAGERFGLYVSGFSASLEPALKIEGIETPKTSATRSRGIPRSTAASTFSLRSFEYGFILQASHIDQSLGRPL